MKLEVYSVYDKAVKAFLPPVYVRSRGEVLRSFAATVNEKDNQMNRYASDYVLFALGVFDDAGGVFECREPERVVSAVEVLLPEEVFTADNKLNGGPRRELGEVYK